MNKRYIYILTIIFGLMASGCGTSTRKHSGEKPILAVSIEPLRHIVESLAGDEYDVVTILDKGANPETFDPSMSRRLAADRSSAYFTVGAFPFENTVAESGSGNVKCVDVSNGITRLYGTHSHGEGEDCGHEADPHVWSSAKNSIIMAANIAKTLSELNPDNAAMYNQRLDSLVEMIERLDENLAAELGNIATRSFAIWHPSLSYLANDYGLKQIAVGEESKEMSPLRLKEVIEKAKADSVKVFFFQKEFDSRQAVSINDQIGARMVTIDPLAYDWMSQLKFIGDELSK